MLLAAVFSTILAQIVAMALISQYNVHPDERSHVTVADYYLHWWIPPAAGDTRVISSLSAYGHSYHYNSTPVYFLAGKAVAPLKNLIRHPFLAFRFFNVALFTALVIVALLRRDENFALLLLLFPAQVWYLFSCFNDDASALFLCLLCCWQIMYPDTILTRFLAADTWRRHLHGALLFALMLALILLSKRNYHVFLAFLGFYAAWMIAFSGDLRRAKRLASRWCAIGLAAICFAWPRYSIDAMVNDPDAPGNKGMTKHERILDMVESYATRGFRPSQLGTEDGYPGLKLKQQGVPFTEIFTHPWFRWHEVTLKSLVGAYAYARIFSDTPFYLAIFMAYASLLGNLVVLVIRHGTRADRLFAVACSLFCAGLVLASAYHSWTVDFVPHGRYLFPGFGILFIAILRFRAFIPGRILWRHGVLIWLLSCYSFIFTGLRLIPKFAS